MKIDQREVFAGKLNICSLTLIQKKEPIHSPVDTLSCLKIGRTRLPIADEPIIAGVTGVSVSVDVEPPLNPKSSSVALYRLLSVFFPSHFICKDLPLTW